MITLVFDIKALASLAITNFAALPDGTVEITIPVLCDGTAEVAIPGLRADKVTARIRSSPAETRISDTATEMRKFAQMILGYCDAADALAAAPPELRRPAEGSA